MTNGKKGNPIRTLPYTIAFFAAFLLLMGAWYAKWRQSQYVSAIQSLEQDARVLNGKLSEVEGNLASISGELIQVKSQDQRVRNDALETELTNIKKTYQDAMETYESLITLREQTTKTSKLDSLFAKCLQELSNRKYDEAQKTITTLKTEMNTLKVSLAQASEPAAIANATVSNAPPAQGFNRQRVKTEQGDYTIDIIAGSLANTRVVVESASDETCTQNCPVLSLSEYVSRSGGYAGINGSYFCPETYPSCVDKKNSFDTLLMNGRTKKYLNSDNNVYSVVPAVIFLGSSVRFVEKSLEWGRDTGNDGVLANQPLLVFGGQNRFNQSGDTKQSGKGTRSFVANKGSTVYIGVVYSATVAEVASVLTTLGMDNGLNLDSGGSTALWYGGYKVGPGRNIPNAIVFVRK